MTSQAIDEAWNWYRTCINKQVTTAGALEAAREILTALEEEAVELMLDSQEAGHSLNALLEEAGVATLIVPIVDLEDHGVETNADDIPGSARSGTIDYYDQPGHGIPKPLGVEGVMTVVAVVKG